MLPFPEEPDLAAVDLPGAVRPPIAGGLPDGYVYGVTRYADIILAGAFPGRLGQLVRSLAAFRITLDELRAGGGGRTEFVRRFDDSLRAQDDSWGKRNITIVKRLGFDDDAREIARVRGHEIDMFGLGEVDQFPGVAVEMEWNNKDPFYDRDLNNFAALHREGAIAVGVIVTRGPRLHELIAPVIRSKQGGFKYGQSTTHWNKLIPRVNLGGGGECPLLLVGIEPERVGGIEVVAEVCGELVAADAARHSWRDHFPSYAEAQAATAARKTAALNRLPPV
ncbi:MAG: BglII/BstYI family type II restriction endonuclease [Acidimicrobiales bacterium]|nr:BglII/BstYI family type II restriction endonuclease [Acidimicrobiales bacterium]